MKKSLLKMLSLLLCGLMLITVMQTTIFAEGEDDMYITDLKVNNLAEPIGIDTVPTFRWVNNMSGYARSQSAYQIIVASTVEKAAAHDGDIWDSGKVESSLNYDIVYGGDALSSRTEYFFVIQVWDEKGNSAWSDVSSFGTGILDDSEWSAKWIGITDGDSVPCDITLDGANWIWFKDGAASSAAGSVYFRKSFAVDLGKEIDEILLATTMDDYGNIFVNGKTALIVKNSTNEWKNGKVVNITSLACEGDNVIAAGVTNTGSSAGFIAKIEIRYSDGSIDTVVTDKSWKCSNSVSSTSGWERMGTDDSAWVTPDQSVVYGKSPWYENVVMPKTMQINTGGGAPMLRKTFDISKDVKRANIYISGLGLYELYVNGKLPEDTVLNPAHTQYEDTVHYRAYDVTDMLTSGKNAIAVELGNYFYNSDFYTWMKWCLATYRDKPKLLFELHVEYADGTKEVIVTDESWKTYEYGPTVYNDIYTGEHYDARREVDGWTEADFDDSTWKNAVEATAPTGDLVFENMEPIRRIKTFVPTVESKGDGIYVIKNPVMTAGWAKINFAAPEGTEIKIIYGEKLNDLGFVEIPANGDILQIDKFITSGGNDVYEPKYSYKGYEYIQIENYQGKLTAEDIECYLIANDISDISEFETGDSRINFMHEMMLRTITNNLQGKLTDTPVYEKNGWTGDVNFALDAFNYNFDFSNVIQKILVDMRDSQNANGVVAQNVPAAFSGSSSIPIWSSIFINGYYENWHVNGIKTDFAENYDAIRLQTLDYIKCIKANGWVWTTGSYADWVSPNPSGVYTTGKTTHAPEGAGIIGSAYVYRTLGEMAEMAEYLGKSEDAAEYREAMANIYTAFNEKFYLADKGYYDTGFWNETYDAGRSEYRQASNIIPLMFGLCPEEYEESVVKSIVDDIKAKDNHLDVGAVGTKYILPMLSKYGYGDLAMTLVQQDTYPSWGYWISLGANTCWETYEYNSRSRNHFFLGTYTDWFYKNLAGVRDFANGYETVELCPEIHPEIGYVNYSIKTVRGELVSYWRFTGDNKLVWDITIPVGATATVYLPASADISEYECITDNGEYLTVPSGSYTFVMDAEEFDVDKSLLKKAVESAESIDQTLYDRKSLDTLTLAISKGELVISDENATQFEVCAAVDVIEKAVDELSENEERKALSLLVASGKNISAENFPSVVFDAFSEILLQVEKVLCDGNSDSAALNGAYTVLGNAMHAISDYCFGNVALGKDVKVTSTLTSDYWAEEKLTDGSRENLRGSEVCGWTSNSLTGFQHSEGVCVDLGALYEIDKINIMPAGAALDKPTYAFPKDYTLSVSSDGENWITVHSETDCPAPLVGLLEFEFEPTLARYIRFIGSSLRQKPTDGNRYRMQISEIEAYNTAINYSDLDLDGDTDLIDGLKLVKLAVNGEASLLDAVKLFKNIAS